VSRGVRCYATRRAWQQAEELRLGCIENLVEAGILCGQKKAKATGLSLRRDERVVWIGPRLAAVCAKDV
jgi:hypothetical protein